MTGEPEGLIAQGYGERRAGRPAEAKRRFVTAAELSRNSSERVTLAQALIGLGQIERDLGNLAPARRNYEEALAIVRTFDDASWLAHTVRHVGDIFQEQGLIAEALPCYAEALALYRRDASTGPLDLANTLRGYALLEERLGDPGAAAAMWREARDLYASLDVSAGVNESQNRLARLESR